MDIENENKSNDGSDIFWPGYVDAVTNLVLNLLFLLTVMTVAVFMFALELGRVSAGGMGEIAVVATNTASDATPKEREATVVEELKKQNAALKREVVLLTAQRTPKNVQGGPMVTIPGTSAISKPSIGLDITMATDAAVIVRFTDEAVALTAGEQTRLREALKSIVASGKSRIFVEVPTGFSEAKRMGFYRAMAVRNLLIEMNMPQDRIDVVVREGKTKANASIVRVTAQ